MICVSCQGVITKDEEWTSLPNNEALCEDCTNATLDVPPMRERESPVTNPGPKTKEWW